MADQEKTEQPTGRKLEKSREEGQVAKSTEISSFAVFSSGIIIIFMFKGFIGSQLATISTTIFGSLDSLTISRDQVQGLFGKGVIFYFVTLAPLLLGLVIFGFVANVAQIGFKFTPKALKPKMNKFNPGKGLKRIFASSSSLVEVGKALLKFILIGGFTFIVLKSFVLESVALVNFTIPDIIGYMTDSAYSLVWKLSLIFAVLAIGDLVWQRKKFKKDMMMTKQEVKEENKQTEGDPEVKSKIKSIQMSMARSRMMQDVPNADVVITNPTHYAIALKYSPGEDAAPKVLAKGVDGVAQRIKAIATENGVPLHEDRPLARSLYKMCEVGEYIPPDLFKAVAQILAYVFNLKKNKKKSIV